MPMTATPLRKFDPRRIARSLLMQNVAALYGVQVGRKLIPLVTIPYLARVLGIAGWGKVAFVTAVSEFVVIAIEFGFNLSATREIARHRNSPAACGEVMSGVLGAQALLALVGVSLAVLASQWIPLLHDNPALLMGGLVYGISQGFAPLWFFQGLERMRLSSALEITGKLGTLCGMFLFIHSPADAWKWMALCGIAPTISTVVALSLAYQTIPLRRPTFRLVSTALRMGWPMFVFRSAESLYGVGNALLLGLFAGPEIVGYFASAEKISKAAYGLLTPIRDSLFPRLSHLAKTGGMGAAALAKQGAAVMIGGGLLLGAGIFATAPLLIRLVLGGEYAPAVSTLRILAFLPVLLSITNSAGMQWLLPLGKDAVINRIIIMAGLLNLALSLFLAPRFAHIGMAWAVVCSEAFVSVSMVAAVANMMPQRLRAYAPAES
jgi:PST family polysaccharide transporter